MAKQLFNSSEKSNFILNLTEEKYSKMAAAGLISAALLTSLATAIPLISGSKFYALTSAGLSVAGVICMIIAFIGAIKKYIGGKVLVPLAAMGVTVLWAIFSLLDSYDMNVAIYGFSGRGEGLLAIIFYVSFFAAAAAIKRESAVRTFVIGIIVSGLINSAVALVQIFGGALSEYKSVGYQIEINAASGFCQSPLFFAMVLSLSIAAALMGFVIFDKKSTKILCIISACLFSFVIMFTYSFIGICGAVLAVIAAVIVIFATHAPKIKLLSVLTVIVPAAAAVAIVQAGMIGNISEYRLYDGRILWFADSYMRLSSGGLYSPEQVDIDDTYDVYYVLNNRTLDIISANGLLGTGPDQLVYPQLYTMGGYGEDASIEDIVNLNSGTFDRVYNEYLNTAATRGIPSAAVLVATLGAVIIIGIGSFKKTKNGTVLMMTMLTIMGALLYLIGCSNTAFAPIFWAAAGCACASLDKSEPKKAPEKQKKK